MVPGSKLLSLLVTVPGKKERTPRVVASDTVAHPCGSAEITTKIINVNSQFYPVKQRLCNKNITGTSTYSTMYQVAGNKVTSNNNRPGDSDLPPCSNPDWFKYPGTNVKS